MKPLEGDRPTHWPSCQCLGQTLMKEFYEELLGGDPQVRHQTHDDKAHAAMEAVERLMRRHGRARMIGLGFALDTGNYELVVILQLGAAFRSATERFYRRHPVKRRDGTFVPNWESLHIERISADRHTLPAVLDKRDWVPGSAVALTEALATLGDEGSI